MGKHIPLGKAAPDVGVAKIEQPSTLEEKIEALQKQVEDLTRVLYSTQHALFKSMLAAPPSAQAPQLAPANPNVNTDGVEIGITLLGPTQFGWFHSLIVAPDGYYLGPEKFDSLTAAATRAVGYKRNGWTYWTVPDGRTIKEALGK